MSPIATIANTLWVSLNLPAYWRFRRALRNPHIPQRRKLQWLLAQNADTEFGRKHAFDKIKCYEEFNRKVPLGDYASLEPWIERIRQGESNILTREPVTHFIPTSGSMGARKLIPFTSGLQCEFNAAIAPWLINLNGLSPGIIIGPAYWSVSPAIQTPQVEKSAVPIGFDTDAAYLGGARRRLAEAVMAVPPGVGRAKSLESFRYKTLLHLIRCRDLRLISIWHPSFLTLLLDALPGLWDDLVNKIETGTDTIAPRPRRAVELRGVDLAQPKSLWPNLRVISCWGDGAASPALEDLRRRFPGVSIQPKGLIATEAFVTLPWGQHHPLAIGSHFFEFIDSEGRVFPVEEVRAGEEYEIVATTAGGLWRYRLGDRVKVTGFLKNTPSLKFLGRSQEVSDLFGEKLSEPFVNEALHEVFGVEAPRFALLAPDEYETRCCYTLYIEGMARPHWTQRLEGVLRRNLHYAYCRDLGQLSPLQIFVISGNAFELFVKQQAASGTRLGNIKPVALSRASNWSKVFTGSYVHHQPPPVV